MFSAPHIPKYSHRFLCYSCLAESPCLLSAGCGVFCRKNKNCESINTNVCRNTCFWYCFPPKEIFNLEKYSFFSLAISRTTTTFNYSCSLEVSWSTSWRRDDDVRSILRDLINPHARRPSLPTSVNGSPKSPPKSRKVRDLKISS